MMRVWSRLRDIHDSFSVRDRVLFSSVVFSALVLAFVLYRAIFPTVGLRVFTNPLPVVSLSYGSTRAVMYGLNFCKYVDATSTVHRELRQVDKPIIISLYSTGFALAKGCDQVHIVEPMPAYVPPGRYILRIVFTYRVNARSDPETLETEVFELQ